MDTRILANIRGSAPRNMAEATDDVPELNNRGEQIMAQGLPPLAQLVSLGNSFWARTATAAAPVTSIPTTAALLGLWNGESANGKSYVIDSIFVVQTAVTAAIQNTGLLVNVSTQAVITALANTIVPRGMLANRVYNGKARLDVGITLDANNGVAANWQPMGTTPSAQNTLQIGTITDYDVKGGIILPPGGQLAMSVLAGAATATSVQLGVRWHELVLPPAV